MNTLRHSASRRCGALLMLAAMAGIVHAPAAAQTQLADQPVFTNTGVPGNLALALSVEFPTAVSVAHTNNTYSSANTYLGYFDPAKCYLYAYVAAETATDKSHFYPAGAATNRTCTGTDNTKWSGNFLNWATMQTIDPFRWALTGGYRVVDTTSVTLIEKAWASGQGGTGNFPNRSLGTNALVSANTPFDAWASMAMRVQGLGNKMRFTVTGGVDNTPVAYDPAVAVNGATVYEVSVRVKVCDSNTAAAGPLEGNCTAYPNGSYKPTGLLQQYSERIRYSAFGYLNDSNLQRDGGVLRARQKFVGPTITVPTLPAANNAAREWDPETGILAINPDSTDASDTATLFGTPVSNSGVINYLNKFGQITPGSYKTYDPVGELYYAAIRYFKNLGNVPEWTAKSSDTNTNRTWVDGFPVITAWDDPIQYSCQKNFVLGIGDVNSHADKNVPGPTSTASEPAKPAAVSADTTVDAVAATNKLGVLHGGLGATAGNTTNWGGCCSNNSALMAGIAYDANTRDIRPDILAVPKTKGKQTVQTYWLDILEFQTYKANNQFYLATKYGGFKAPDSFDPYTRDTDIPKEWWSTTGETVGSQDRPDTYFTASRPDQMVTGLTRAFANIASQLQAFTTSFSTALPQVALEGVGSYASRYDSGNWTGEVTGNTTSFDAVTGTPSQVVAWNFSAKLAAQITGTGWNTGRKMITWNTSTNQGVPFRSNSISSSQLLTLDTVYRDGDDSSDYLNYLRGDPTHEVGSTVAGSAKIYRSRTGPVGDIVGSKAKPVGPPVAPFSAATNAGYAAFRTTWKDRAPMLYVGTNAGVMHAIKASVTATDGGEEVFAYVPGPIYQGANGVPVQTGLQHRGDPDFTHKNLVDGPVAVFDIDLGKTQGGTGTPTWRSVLVGAMGKGGKAYFAIDVTDPSAFSSETAAAAKVMWEFTHPDLGYTYGEPAAVKTKKYGWVLIFGSGHNNSDGIGYIFIVNPRNGALLEKISTGVGTPTNPAGLSQVQAFLPDRTDFTAETLYAGDLLGNLWRLDLTPATGAYASPTKIAELTDANGDPVPVTSRPLIVIQPKTNRRYVTVGSGKLLANGDVGSTQPQGFYAIIDGTGNVFNTAATLPAGMTFPIRNTGPNNRLLKLTDLTQTITLDLTTQIGWWLDLGTVTGGSGWRVITDSTSFLGTIAFAAMVPSGDVCSPSGTSRVYAIDLGTGQSTLRDGDTIISYNTSLSGVVIDLRFYSVNGKLRLIGSDDKGGAGSFDGKWPTGAGVRRLNWRELPLAD